MPRKGKKLSELSKERMRKTKALKKKDNRGGDHGAIPPALQFQNLADGDNAKFLKHALFCWDKEQVDYHDPQAVVERIEAYFVHSATLDLKPTLNGLGNALGVSIGQLYDWRNGVGGNPTTNGLVKKVTQIMADLHENYMQNGKINPVAGIFLGKNYYGMKDQTELIFDKRVEKTTAENIETLLKAYGVAEVVDGEVVDDES